MPKLRLSKLPELSSMNLIHVCSCHQFMASVIFDIWSTVETKATLYLGNNKVSFTLVSVEAYVV